MREAGRKQKRKTFQRCGCPVHFCQMVLPVILPSLPPADGGAAAETAQTILLKSLTAEKTELLFRKPDPGRFHKESLPPAEISRQKK